jgi:hypothetical protein
MFFIFYFFVIICYKIFLTLLKFNLKKQYLPKHFKSSLINYSTSWVEDLNEKDFLLEKISTCFSCSFTSKNRKLNFSHREVILITLCSKIFRFLPFVRTLRTTRSKTKIIVFIDNQASSQLSSNHLYQIKGCGIIFKKIEICPFIPGLSIFLFQWQIT